MTITINKDSFPRFTKRLKKSLQQSGIDLPLHQVKEIAAQSFGKENLHELNTLFNQHNKNSIIDEKYFNAQNTLIDSLKEYDWFIEEASLKIGAGMGRIGQSIGKEYIREAVVNSLQHILHRKNNNI